MPTQTISSKELRLNYPRVIKALERGEPFTLIHRSKPVADIIPRQNKTLSKDEAWNFWINPPAHLRFRSKKSAVELIRELRD